MAEPMRYLKTVLMAVLVVVALAAGLAVLSFGLTRMFGIRKRPERAATLPVALLLQYDGALPVWFPTRDPPARRTKSRFA